ncbi:DUF5994 family protein [Mycobacterium sp. 2YAF39]|uniref:DUF5994 family protein n=1 Tax=Mycobacterium sp. 2YAF39 TaxID=3233033 RepID=UPI003F9723F1
MQDHLQVSERGSDAIHGRRVRLTSHRGGTAAVDGAWWPYSRELVSELPELLASLGDRLGPLVGVGYRRDDWTDTPPATLIDGRTVDLLGFDGAEAPSVILIGNDGHHVTLAIVAPEVGERVARQVLDAVPVGGAGVAGSAREATAARFTTDVARRLAAHEGLDDDERTAQIRRWCDQAATQFATARVQSFVPILVEHIVHEQMLRTRSQNHSQSS